MPKVTAPLLSFAASGQIAKTQVYSRWRGIEYVRRYAVPNNPQSTRQTEVRDVFRFLNAYWLHAGSIAIAPWDAFAVGKPLLGRNVLMKSNMRPLTFPSLAADLADMIFSPGAGGGLPPTSITPTPAATSVSYAVAVPASLPVGWTIAAAQGVMIADVAPNTVFDGLLVEVEDTTSTYALNFTGLTTATDYVAGIWLKWNKPDGSFAYSIGLTDQVTTS